MIRTKKPAAKSEKEVTKGYKPLYVGEVQIYFKKVPSLVLPTYALYMGGLKAVIMSQTVDGWKIQCNLPHLPITLGRTIKKEQEARQICIKIAQTFCTLINEK